MCSRRTECSNLTLPAPATSWAGPFIPGSHTSEELKALGLLESPAGGYIDGLAAQYAAVAGERLARRERKRARAQEARAAGRRSGTVCGRWNGQWKRRVPDLRLSGLWLRAAGFDLGQAFEVEVRAGELVIRAV